MVWALLAGFVFIAHYEVFVVLNEFCLDSYFVVWATGVIVIDYFVCCGNVHLSYCSLIIVVGCVDGCCYGYEFVTADWLGVYGFCLLMILIFDCFCSLIVI